jgi:hypothetical protein
MYEHYYQREPVYFLIMFIYLPTTVIHGRGWQEAHYKNKNRITWTTTFIHGRG